VRVRDAALGEVFARDARTSGFSMPGYPNIWLLDAEFQIRP